FVAVDRSEVVNEGGWQQRLIQPVEAVEGWRMLEIERLAGAVSCAAMPRGAFALPKSPQPWEPTETETVDSCLMNFDAEELCSAEPSGPVLGEPAEPRRMRKRQRAESQPRKAKARHPKSEPSDEGV